MWWDDATWNDLHFQIKELCKKHPAIMPDVAALMQKARGAGPLVALKNMTVEQLRSIVAGLDEKGIK